MTWTTTSSSSLSEEGEGRHLITPLILSQRTVKDGSNATAGAPSSVTTPIPDEIPTPTGGIHTFQTTEHLRHRHGSFSTPTKPPSQDLRAMSLDDADAAAGIIRSISGGSEPRRLGSVGHLEGKRAAQSLSPLDRMIPPKISREFNGENISLQEHSDNFFRNGYSLRPAPELQKMDRAMGVSGSETDFLLLSSSASIQSESSHVSDDDYRNRRRDGMKIMKNRCESFPPLMVGGNGTVPLYGLPVIEGSPINEKRQIFGANAERATIITTQKTNQHDAVNEFVVFGWDMSNYSRRSQFLISAGGTFLFSLLYGYLQELISVELCHRKLGLFLAAAQFLGYTLLSYFFRKLEKGSAAGENLNGNNGMNKFRRPQNPWKLRGIGVRHNITDTAASSKIHVPLELYLGLSVLRAIDLGMTNMAMQYVNYPAKTLMKSTRVVFTMLFGVLVTKKRYGMADFAIVGLMVAGLGMFMHADASTSAVFQPLGIIMLIISLLCDGAISNMSESIMNKYKVGQDEFIFRLYSVALFFVCLAAGAKGDLRGGLAYLTTPGTLKEMEEGLDPTWSVTGKIVTIILFSTTGFLSSSCSAAITKTFGALAMSITSTARKATTIFLSFALFPNECTFEHIGGIVLFIGSLIAKSLRASRHGRHQHHSQHHHNSTHEWHSNSSLHNPSVLEMEQGGADSVNPMYFRKKSTGDDAV
ncbi:hypothetical protein ACHAXS_003832 [Conticribra weissflogii]